MKNELVFLCNTRFARQEPLASEWTWNSFLEVTDGTWNMSYVMRSYLMFSSVALIVNNYIATIEQQVTSKQSFNGKVARKVNKQIATHSPLLLMMNNLIFSFISR